MTCFQVFFLFQDGIPASVCGFCRRGHRQAVVNCILSLSRVRFGVEWTEGLLVDSHFARLLAQVLLPEREAIFLTGGCIQYAALDGPCGGILGDLFQPPESALQEKSRLQLSNGISVQLVLRPGIGAAAFFCFDPQKEQALLEALSVRFPAPDLLSLLAQAGAGYLWVLDYAPGNPVRSGSCQVCLPSGIIKKSERR